MMGVRIIYGDFGPAQVQHEALERFWPLIFGLCDYIEEVKIESMDEIYLKFRDGNYGKEDLKEIAFAMAHMCPDEVDEEGDYIRLWWD